MRNAAIIPFRDDIDMLTYSTEPFFHRFSIRLVEE